MEQLLFYSHYALLLGFGVVVSFAFAGVAANKPNFLRMAATAALCGALQMAVFVALGEKAVWQWYPVITHLPIILSLRFALGKRFLGAVTATALAYLCCQPAKWFGLATLAVTASPQTELLVRIVGLLVTAGVVLKCFAAPIAHIYSCGSQSSWVFGVIPVVYYLFDYTVGIYSTLWAQNHQLSVEFLPFFLCIGHLIFCAVYYREYELKNEAERKENLLRITVEQQAKEVEMIRRSEAEIRLLRHDIRLFLNSLSTCIEQSDHETARKMISGFFERAEASSLKHYCSNDTLNYLLSDYAAQCREKGVQFHQAIELTTPVPDEILFASIVANALDNALNAQKELAQEERVIRLMLKSSNGKILLSVKNPCREAPLFQDGLPLATRKNHGNGTRSILYAIEKMGGNCQFRVEDGWFIVRVVV